MSRGACICSSASRSRRRFPTAAAAPPAPALPIARWRTCSIVAAPFRRPTAISTQQAVHFGTQTPAAYSQRGARLIIMACRLDRCGTFRRPTAISTQQAAHFGTQTPAAGFAPPTRHTRSPIFSPHATYRRLISSYKFLLSPSLFPVAAPIGPPLRAVGHRPAGIGAVCSSFLSAPRRRGSNGPFFHLQVLPVLAAPPAPLQASAPVALPRPPLGGRSPRPSAAQSPESRLCGGLSASIHPLHPPHRPCPKIIVLRSASL